MALHSRLCLAFVIAAIIAIGAAGCGEEEGGDAESSGPATGQERELPDRFDEDRAWELIRRQVSYGQRPAGSPQLRRLAEVLRKELPSGRFEPIPGEPGLRNIVATIPGALPAIVVGAHYDTLTEPRGFVGANNGAAGSAIVVVLANELADEPRGPGAPELRFVLFDGEEPPSGLPEDDPDFPNSGLRGSRAYVAAHGDETGAMILLDYVANKGLRLPREGSSDPALWEEIRAAAKAVGYGEVFPPREQVAIYDDHTPFLDAGIPAVDLIDWSYPGHSLKDGLDRLSRRSADAVGETLVEFLAGGSASR